ncbi:hypothetical protein JJL45_09010 [Tamlana sp. s12]|uniref:hypothetical protein n=1 Tax=Tamlana sp. s12 TaxID=1630406 RepID=UPI000800E32F|nr:hypothetical protein [Tamlana sp. s12]OBQ52903.1 membrane protein [Tamlana sp. s12]QQY81069.1 hypothetical protein JJL45_09010 [Tamlana sp. s12]
MAFNRYIKRAVVGGVISMVIIFLGTLLLGQLSGYKAKILIENSIDGINTLCNTITLASATILALLLTLLGVSNTSKIKSEHYKHILFIAKLDTIVFVASMISFLLFNLPITDSEEIPASWFSVMYYSSLTLSSILSSALIVVVLMLNSTIVSIIQIMGLGITDHPLAIDKKKDEKLEE